MKLQKIDDEFSDILTDVDFYVDLWQRKYCALYELYSVDSIAMSVVERFERLSVIWTENTPTVSA